MRDPIVQVHIADIHFGAVDPKEMYAILEDQFLKPISQLHKLDILSIDGDLFDRKFFANHEAVQYAMRFVDICANICKANNATLVILEGTESHDAFQIHLFDYLLEDPYIDCRIITSLQFQMIKGYKILCIPEEYGKPMWYYQNALKEVYDMVFMHGTVVGSVYGAKEERLNSTKYPVFSIDSFHGCRGPIIAGHVHKSMCLNQYIYYVSNPIRYHFGEEEAKGFAIVIYSDVGHYYRFCPIESFRYDTIPFQDLAMTDPDSIITYLDSLIAQGKTHIRLDMSTLSPTPEIEQILMKYYATNPYLVFKRKEAQNVGGDIVSQLDRSGVDDQLQFILDPNLSPMQKFVNYVNLQEGDGFITIESLKKLLGGI